MNKRWRSPQALLCKRQKRRRFLKNRRDSIYWNSDAQCNKRVDKTMFPFSSLLFVFLFFFFLEIVELVLRIVHASINVR